MRGRNCLRRAAGPGGPGAGSAGAGAGRRPAGPASRQARQCLPRAPRRGALGPAGAGPPGDVPGQPGRPRAARRRPGWRPGLRKHPATTAQLRAISARERAAGTRAGILAAAPAGTRVITPAGARAVTPAIAPAASSGDVGEALDIAVTGPGGAALVTGCTDGCVSNTMFAPNEPVTVSAMIFNSSNPPVSEQVQVAWQQVCGTTTETMATTTVTAASSFGPGGITSGGTPVSASFAIDPASCNESPPLDGEQNYVMDLSATVTGESTGTTDVDAFYGSVATTQTQGCICSPDSSGAAAAQNFRGDAVDTATGEYTDAFTDATTSSPGVPLTVARNYSSGVTAAGPLGPGWTMPWFASLSVNSQTGAVTFISENGSRYTYTISIFGGFAAPLGALSVLADTTDSSGERHRVHPDHAPAGRAVVHRVRAADLRPRPDRARADLRLRLRAAHVGHRRGRAAGRAHLHRVAAVGHRAAERDQHHLRLHRRPADVRRHARRERRPDHLLRLQLAGLLATIVNPDGTTVLQNTYNPAGQVTQSADGTGATTAFSYTTVSGLAETDTTDPDGGVWTDVYEGGLLLETINPLNGTTEYVPGPLVLPIQVTDPLGHVTTLAYSSAGNLTVRDRPAQPPAVLDV